MIFPPPNLTVPWTSLSINPCSACFYIHCFPSDPNLLILVSSDQITFYQSSRVHSLCFKAKTNYFFLCTAVSNGFFFFVTALNECLLRTFLTVCDGDDGVDMFHSLDCIGSLSHSDLCKDRVLSMRRKLERVIRGRDWTIRKILKHLGYCAFAKTN